MFVPTSTKKKITFIQGRFGHHQENQEIQDSAFTKSRKSRFGHHHQEHQIGHQSTFKIRPTHHHHTQIHPLH